MFASGTGGIPDSPGLGGLNVGDCVLSEINVEAQEMVVFNCLKFHGVAKKVVVNESLGCWVRKEVFDVDNETVVNVAVVVEVEIGVVKEIVVQLLPRVFNKSDGHIVQGW